MEKAQFQQIQKWFEKLNKRYDEGERRGENRYTALFHVCTNIKKDVESLKKDMKVVKTEVQCLREDLSNVEKRNDARIIALELAIKELERRINQ